MPPATTNHAHTWQDCESISFDITGSRLPLAYLELVIPIFRIAHIALDAEGPQVGKANFFPSALRLDVETEWPCPYPGSRYLDERPMNVTALRSMGHYWPQMMTALFPIRAAYLDHYPHFVRAGRWEVRSAGYHSASRGHLPLGARRKAT